MRLRHSGRKHGCETIQNDLCNSRNWLFGQYPCVEYYWLHTEMLSLFAKTGQAKLLLRCSRLRNSIRLFSKLHQVVLGCAFTGDVVAFLAVRYSVVWKADLIYPVYPG